MLSEDINRIIQSDLRNATRALSNAGATVKAAIDAGVPTNDLSDQLWFLVRALCHEHGFDLVGMQERSERIASERIASARDKQEAEQE